jgi:hypothetical protein
MNQLKVSKFDLTEELRLVVRFSPFGDDFA